MVKREYQIIFSPFVVRQPVLAGCVPLAKKSEFHASFAAYEMLFRLEHAVTEQVTMSIKVPLDVRDVMVEAAKLARTSPAFLQSIKELVEAHNRPSIQALLTQMMQRMDRFERQLEGFDAELREANFDEFVGPDPDWFTGAGSGKKLTLVGETELKRLLDRGLTDKQIAKRVGISISAVAQRRKRIEFEASMRLSSTD